VVDPAVANGFDAVPASELVTFAATVTGAGGATLPLLVAADDAWTLPPLVAALVARAWAGAAW